MLQFDDNLDPANTQFSSRSLPSHTTTTAQSQLNHLPSPNSSLSSFKQSTFVAPTNSHTEAPATTPKTTVAPNIVGLAAGLQPQPGDKADEIDLGDILALLVQKPTPGPRASSNNRFRVAKHVAKPTWIPTEIKFITQGLESRRRSHKTKEPAQYARENYTLGSWNILDNKKGKPRSLLSKGHKQNNYLEANMNKVPRSRTNSPKINAQLEIKQEAPQTILLERYLTSSFYESKPAKLAPTSLPRKRQQDKQNKTDKEEKKKGFPYLSWSVPENQNMTQEEEELSVYSLGSHLGSGDGKDLKNTWQSNQDETAKEYKKEGRVDRSYVAYAKLKEDRESAIEEDKEESVKKGKKGTAATGVDIAPDKFGNCDHVTDFSLKVYCRVRACFNDVQKCYP